MNGTEYIAAGELGTTEQETAIFIFKKTRTWGVDSGQIDAAVQGLTWVVKVLVLIAAVIAVVQNYRVSCY